jgi:outer membrane lipoprotein carrier protein
MAVSRFLLAGACLLLFASISHASGVADLQAFYQNVHSLSAHFQQVQRDDTGRVMQRARGLFLLSRPKRFRWQYNKPYKQIIVSDGKTFKFYDVDLQQVTIRNTGASLRATPALLLTGGIALKRAFHISSRGTRNGLTWVKLVPKTRDTDFKRIALGLKNQIPKEMVLHDKLGQITQITFSDIKINPHLADSRFTLHIPKGVTVVRH